MEHPNLSPMGSPGGPLQAATAERVNQQRERESIFSHLRGGSRDSSVHDKISQFNNLSVSMQSKQLERKTADAALKRAMVGREEAESELRRYREENKALRKAVEEGKEREKKVGERLETLMVCTLPSSHVVC
jgi:preprotein translocase subunit SecD